jgi:hypothetical protein
MMVREHVIEEGTNGSRIGGAEEQFAIVILS